MRKYRSIGIKERTNLIYELGLENDYHNHIIGIIESTKETSIRKCKEYINFIHTYEKTPSQVAPDKLERSLGRWMENQRSLGIDRIYKPVLKLMEDAGYLHLFNRRNSEVNQLKKCERFIEYVKIHKKSPSEKSVDPIEKELGTWIGCVRKNNTKGKYSYKVYQSTVNALTNAGLSYMMIPVDRKQHGIDMLLKFINFLDVYNKYPPKTSNDPDVVKLGNWVSQMKQSLNGKGKGKSILHQEMSDIIKNSKYPNMFNSNWRDDLRK